MKKFMLMRGNYKDHIHAWLLLLLFSGAIVSSAWHDVHLWQSYPKTAITSLDTKHPAKASIFHVQTHHCLFCDFHAVPYDIPNDIQTDLDRSLAKINILVVRTPLFLANHKFNLLPARAPPFLI